MMTTNLHAEGFLRRFPAGEYRVHGHGRENESGLLVMRVVALRAYSDPVVEAANSQGLQLEASFDDDHPDLVLLETIGMLSPIEHMAKTLSAKGYSRLDEFRNE